MMAGAAGRRNILRELSAQTHGGDGSNFQNTILPLTPPSPDETVIQHRGQRKKSATYNYDAPDPVFFKTPTKSPKKNLSSDRYGTPTKITLTRSSPRKKLRMTPNKLDFDEAAISDIAITCKRVKKGRLEKVKPNVPLEKSLKALSHSQLVELITDAVKRSPDLREVFEKLHPKPDLSPVEDRLHMLQRNVYKSFPRNVWGSQDSSFCYLRVRTHLEAFKKECLELCNQFMESYHWTAIFEYIFMAWRLALGLPDWTSVTQNKIKSSCIKQLGAQCVIALKTAELDEAALAELIDRMEEFREDPSVGACIKLAEDLMLKT